MHKITFLVLLIILSSCVPFRTIKYGSPSIDDYKIFEQEQVENANNKFYFVEKDAQKKMLDTLKLDVYFEKSDTFKQLTLDEVLEYIRKPVAAIIIKNDTILYEQYKGGLDKCSQTTIFSVTKTVTSLLCGIALKEGYIRGLNDFVIDYIPELKDADKKFASLTIEHLLDMSAGLKFKESYGWNPFSKIARLYYGDNSFNAIRDVKFMNEPGKRYHYDSMTTAILGLLIERAVGVSYAQYLSEKLWKPLGMEQSASISLDSKKSHIAKSYAGLTTNVRDLAKIGRLYLNKGNWNGVQIIDTAYVERSHSKNMVGENNRPYSYSWYWGTSDHKKFSNLDSLYTFYKNQTNIEVCGAYRNRETGKYEAIIHRGGFWAYGLYGQVLYMNTKKNYIAVFLGADRIEDFYNIFDRLFENL